MPELNLPSLYQPEAAYYLLAVMWAPDDEAAQRDFAAALHGVPVRRALHQLVEDRGRWTQALQMTDWVRELVLKSVSLPRWEEVAPRVVGTRNKLNGGHLACRTLMLVLACAAHAPEHASLGAIRRFWQHLLKGQRGVSHANLKILWGRFMPVAHLWAAMDFAPEPWHEAGRTGNGSKLAEWLALAERLRERGEAYVPVRADGPLLNPAKTWKVPNRFILPPVDSELPLPSAEDLKQLGLVRH